VDDQTRTTVVASPRSFFDAGRHRALDHHDLALWEGLEQAAEGGKQFRPRLLLAAHRAFGGRDTAVAQRVADAVELLHTAFVIHDDVIDGDDVRRGRRNIVGTFTGRAMTTTTSTDRATRYGEAAGLLAGDLALAGAVREVALCGAAPEVTARLLDLLQDVLHRSAAGELADVRVSMTRAGGLPEVLDIAEWKTAAYSFQLPLQAGALLAGASQADLDRIGEVGRLLGTAFQLQDDLDGVFADATATGKDPLSDLREGKYTALVAVAQGTPWWPRIAPHLGSADLDETRAAQLRRDLVACGARAAVEDLAAELHDAAREACSALPVAVRAALGDLLDLASLRVRGAA
jgi:geranylgeranyl diphosphate synthase, type II